MWPTDPKTRQIKARKEKSCCEAEETKEGDGQVPASLKAEEMHVPDVMPGGEREDNNNSIWQLPATLFDILIYFKYKIISL